ncbi:MULTISPECIES: hypothetical protein [Pseudomonas]|uniref:hypothetical protein n=1 Tax=Pseudomonas TaxID=286 RepID=UPI0020937004|nr:MULTISPECIES: hypothetical protein [Pseudomonas]USU02981.1 hypothetical protein NF680_12180 [Pseudomonas siliginis]
MTDQSRINLSAVPYAQATDPKAKRAYAVSAALELIAVRVLNNTSSGILESELGKLSSYADTIQAALETK